MRALLPGVRISAGCRDEQLPNWTDFWSIIHKLVYLAINGTILPFERDYCNVQSSSNSIAFKRMWTDTEIWNAILCLVLYLNNSRLLYYSWEFWSWNYRVFFKSNTQTALNCRGIFKTYNIIKDAQTSNRVELIVKPCSTVWEIHIQVRKSSWWIERQYRKGNIIFTSHMSQNKSLLIKTIISSFWTYEISFN